MGDRVAASSNTFDPVHNAGQPWIVEEVVTLCLLMLFLTHFYIPILQPVQSALFAAASDDQTVVGQAISLSAWIAACILMLQSWRVVVAQLPRLFWLLALTVLPLISTGWSQDAGITLRKSIFLILTTFFGFYFAGRYPIQRQLRLLCVAALIAATMSISLALLLPKYGLDHDAHEGVWLGIFTQKNVCAREMLFLLASVLPFSPRTRVLKQCRYAAAVAIVVVIVGTQSKTALLIMLLLLAGFPCLGLIRRISRGVLFVVVSCAIVLAGFAITLAASPFRLIASFLGRDGTMTGRTEIWHAVLQAITKHPLLGYGFAAFWLSLRGESANIILALRWAVPAAHNGFLDIWLQLGAIGLLLFVVGFLFALRSAMTGLRQKSFSRAAWPMAILLLTLVYNLDESSLMQPNDLLWILYVATLVNLANPISSGRTRSALQFSGKGSNAELMLNS